MSAHTPGPWIVLGDDEEVPGFPVIEVASGECGRSGFRSIANIQPSWVDEKPVLDAEAWAIARLAAAAPDLLSIAKRFVALPSGAWHPERHAAEEAELMRDANAAIAKAEGRS